MDLHDESERGKEQQYRQHLRRNQISSNTTESNNSGFPRDQQYTSYGNPSVSNNISANAPISTQYHTDPFTTGFDQQPLNLINSPMATTAGLMQHASATANNLYTYQQQQQQDQYHQNQRLPQHLQHQQQTYAFPSSYPSITSGSANPLSSQYASHQFIQEQQSSRKYLEAQQQHQQQQEQLYNQYPLNPTTSLHNQATEIIGPRPPADRPVIKLSKYLIDTYKYINIIYEQEQEEKRRAKAERRKPRNKTERPIPSGARNHGWDDENYDYILTPNELINDRYKVQERLGKGSFGQVVRAIDTVKNVDVAIKIIKSKKPFQVQARTEIEILTHLRNRDPEDEHNIGKIRFVYFNFSKWWYPLSHISFSFRVTLFSLSSNNSPIAHILYVQKSPMSRI